MKKHLLPHSQLLGVQRFHYNVYEFLNSFSISCFASSLCGLFHMNLGIADPPFYDWVRHAAQVQPGLPIPAIWRILKANIFLYDFHQSMAKTALPLLILPPSIPVTL